MESWPKNLGIKAVNPGVFDGDWRGSGPAVDVVSPINGKLFARARRGGREVGGRASAGYVVSPINGKLFARVRQASPEDRERAITRALHAFDTWRVTPAPV